MHITSEANHELSRRLDKARQSGEVPADTQFTMGRRPTGQENEVAFFVQGPDGQPIEAVGEVLFRDYLFPFC